MVVPEQLLLQPGAISVHTLRGAEFIVAAHQLNIQISPV
jgi:hypothetical protein